MTCQHGSECLMVGDGMRNAAAHVLMLSVAGCMLIIRHKQRLAGRENMMIIGCLRVHALMDATPCLARQRGLHLLVDAWFAVDFSLCLNVV